MLKYQNYILIEIYYNNIIAFFFPFVKLGTIKAIIFKLIV